MVTSNDQETNMKNLARLLVVALIFSASTYFVSAQGAGGRRGFDPEQFRARMMERFKTELKVSDQEWKVMQPMIENVMAKQRESRGGRGGMMFGMRGGPPSRDEDRPQGNQDRRADRRGSDRFQAPPEVEALRNALDSENTSSADLKAKLAALRESRKKSQAELEKARNDLRKIVTVRQEAQLVLMGILD